jgi:hypothetical protein
MIAKVAAKDLNRSKGIVAYSALTVQCHVRPCKLEPAAISVQTDTAELLWPIIRRDFSKAPKCRPRVGGKHFGPTLRAYFIRSACVLAWTLSTYALATVGSPFK